MPMMGGRTVFDRVKKTGYMTGPEHKMNSALEDQSDDDPTMNADDAADPDGGEETGEPPNLRDSAERPASCGDCQNFQPAGQDGGSSCLKYGGAEVMPNEVCDGYEGASDEADEGGSQMSSQVSGVDSQSSF